MMVGVMQPKMWSAPKDRVLEDAGQAGAWASAVTGPDVEGQDGEGGLVAPALLLLPSLAQGGVEKKARLPWE